MQSFHALLNLFPGPESFLSASNPLIDAGPALSHMHASPGSTLVNMQELGLRDYARIDGWVLPEDPPRDAYTEAERNVIMNQVNFSEPGTFPKGTPS